MRPTIFFSLVLFILSLAPEGRAQDASREMMESHRIERRVTGASAIPSTTAIPEAPTLQTQTPSAVQQNAVTTQTTVAAPTPLPATPALAGPELPQNLPQPSVPSLGTPTATSNIDQNLDPFRPKIRVPRYEAAYLASLRHEAEERKKRKSLMNAILDEIATYGLYLLLGLVVFLLIYALRKETIKAGPPKAEVSSLEAQEKKDIWTSDDLIP